MKADDNTERQPLLGDNSSTTNEAPGSTTAAELTDDRSARSRFIYVAVVGLLINAAVATTADFSGVSLNALIEGAACKQLYPDVTDPYGDERCKNTDVQTRLSLVTGWDMTFSMVPGLLAAVPYGVFADAYGPRALLLLVFAGSVLLQVWQLVVCLNPGVFDIRCLWVGNLFTFIGGGNIGWEAMRYTVASSISSEANRSTVFFYLSVFTMVNSAIVGTPLFAAMQKGAVLTNCISIGTISLGGLLCFALPKDIGKNERRTATENDAGLSPVSRSVKAVKQIVDAVKALFTHNLHLGLLLISLVFTTIGHLESIIRMQYATERYDWSWSKAGFVTSMTSIVSLAVMVVAVPITSHLLLKKFTPIGKDIWISRFGVLCLAAGSFAIGLAPTSALFIAAFAVYRVEVCYTPAVISLIAGIAGVYDARREQTSLLYLCISFMRCAGAIVAGPLLAAAFRAGLHLGGRWIGLPFIVAGCLQAIAAVIVCSARDKSKGRSNEPTH